MVIALAIFTLVLVVAVAGVGAGLWLAFRWMRQFTPEREGELLAELAGLRASQRLGREAGRRQPGHVALRSGPGSRGRVRVKVRQARNYLAIGVAACVGLRLGASLVAPLIVPLTALLIVALAIDLVIGRRLS